MKSSGIQALNKQKALDSYVQEESFELKNQITRLQAQLLEKDKVIVSQGNTINQINNQLNSLQNTLSAKNNEINSLQKEMLSYKNSMTSLEKSLKQKDNIIELVSKNVEEIRLEKQELKEDKKILKNLLFSTEEKLKEKEFQLSLLEKSSYKLEESNKDISQFAGEHISQVEDMEKSLVGDSSSFVVIEND